LLRNHARDFRAKVPISSRTDGVGGPLFARVDVSVDKPLGVLAEIVGGIEGGEVFRHVPGPAPRRPELNFGPFKPFRGIVTTPLGHGERLLRSKGPATHLLCRLHRPLHSNCRWIALLIANLRPVTALTVPSVTLIRAIRLRGVTMRVFYISNDSNIDAERCRISLRKKAPITIFGLNVEGRAACFTGIVTSIQFDSNRHPGARWQVVIGEPAPHRDEDTNETGASPT
jgi:hypothetical protein